MALPRSAEETFRSYATASVRNAAKAHPGRATLLPVYAAKLRPIGAAYCSNYLDLDSDWHFHDAHQIIYPFEESVVVEVEGGRQIIPRQLAAWIPAGVVHRSSFHRVRSVSIFLPNHLIRKPGTRLRTILVTTLMREMMRESMRWPLGESYSRLRTAFFRAMAAFCEEWIEEEADLFLPTSNDKRVQRALDFTCTHMNTKLADVCKFAGFSDRSLRRHVKAQTGLSWEAYRQRARLLQAISLLNETNMAISQIAHDCGFESPSSFSKTFRASMGETPSRFRINMGDC